jgi:hypothetical protein
MNESPTGKVDGMRWLQPVLGQAIVDQDLLDRRHAIAAPVATAQLAGVSGASLRWQNSPYGYLDSIRTSALWAEADHAMRVQTVMGRAIVQFTRRGVLSGTLTADGIPSEFNHRMIDGMAAVGQRMETRFLANWQPNLGRAIVGATQDSAKVSALRQEQLGAAIMQLTTVQTSYDAAHAAIQEQLGGAVVATRMESQMSVASPERSAQNPIVTVTVLHSWPELPMSAIVVASLILMSLFSAGLLVSSRLSGVRVAEMA